MKKIKSSALQHKIILAFEDVKNGHNYVIGAGFNIIGQENDQEFTFAHPDKASYTFLRGIVINIPSSKEEQILKGRVAAIKKLLKKTPKKHGIKIYTNDKKLLNLWGKNRTKDVNKKSPLEKLSRKFREFSISPAKDQGAFLQALNKNIHLQKNRIMSENSANGYKNKGPYMQR